MVVDGACTEEPVEARFEGGVVRRSPQAMIVSARMRNERLGDRDICAGVGPACQRVAKHLRDVPKHDWCS